jgi:hypothetical protein
MKEAARFRRDPDIVPGIEFDDRHAVARGDIYSFSLEPAVAAKNMIAGG